MPLERPRIRVDHISFFDEYRPGGCPGSCADGAVWYEIAYPEGWPGGAHPSLEVLPALEGAPVRVSYMSHPFCRGSNYVCPHGSAVWSWDGNREAPTLSGQPHGSYRCRDPRTGIHVHLYLRGGRILLQDDSTPMDVCPKA